MNEAVSLLPEHGSKVVRNSVPSLGEFSPRPLDHDEIGKFEQSFVFFPGPDLVQGVGPQDKEGLMIGVMGKEFQCVDRI